jgi:hypothetical protein
MEQAGAIRIAPAYRAAEKRGSLGDTLTLQVQEAQFEAVTRSEAWLSSVEELEFSVPLSTPVTSIAFPESGAESTTPESNPPQDRVVVAAIDDAISFANRRFRWLNGKTRFQSIWQQDGLGPHPLMGYGAEMAEAGINAVFANAATLGLDESGIYALAGVEDYAKDAHKVVGRRTAHGAHVADLVFGYEPTNPPPPNEILMWVQLDQAAVRSIHPAGLSFYVYDALWFIVKQTEAIESKTGEKLPIIVNISFGWYTGPHDGSSPLEKAIDRLVQDRSAVAPMCVVLPAGNSRLERTHSRFTLQRNGGNGATKRLEWRLQPDNRAPSMMELWLGRATDTVQLTLTGPGGVVNAVVTSGNLAPLSIGGQNVGWVDYSSLAGAKNQPGIRIHLSPTAPPVALDPLAATVPSGVWTIDIANLGARYCVVDVWIGRSGRLPGWHVLGRQSHFEDALYTRFTPAGRPADSDANSLSHVRRKRTLNGIVTGMEPVVVGGFRASDLESANYSSLSPFKVAGAGGLRTAPDPDVAARSEDSPVRHGVLAAGSRTGSVVAQNGTSVAAPQVARWIANEFLQGRQARRTQVGAAAAQQELNRQQNPTPGEAPFPGAVAAGKGRFVVDLNQLGWGRLPIR